ncbi:cupin domain-containing protein [Ferruginibacter sp. HRS2-29]|nr:cupin domain-containing protein [Ferruginibacter sp. HRS2-29]
MLLATAGLSMLSLPSLAAGKAQSAPKGENLQPFYLPPMEPLQPGPGGIDIRTWVKSAQTNMQFSCVEFAVAAKKMGPAPHYHKDLDELMYVLDGTATVMVEETIYEIPAGGWHFRPRGMVHTFFNNTDKPFRGIDMYFNQNFEDYLEELFHQIIPEIQAKKLGPNDPGIAKRIQQLHEKFGMVGFPEKRKAIIDKYGLIP